MSERIDQIWLGKKIGTATGWDQNDTFSLILYQFEPAKNISIPAGDLCLDFESGKWEIYSSDGNSVLHTGLLLETLK